MPKCPSCHSRKVVVLEKTEEEAFGFEIQVRGLNSCVYVSAAFNPIPPPLSTSPRVPVRR